MVKFALTFAALYASVVSFRHDDWQNINLLLTKITVNFFFGDEERITKTAVRVTLRAYPDKAAGTVLPKMQMKDSPNGYFAFMAVAGF